jgi:1-pyrroline-5-carboxylate dehydrogenase
MARQDERKAVSSTEAPRGTLRIGVAREGRQLAVRNCLPVGNRPERGDDGALKRCAPVQIEHDVVELDPLAGEIRANAIGERMLGAAGSQVATVARKLMLQERFSFDPKLPHAPPLGFVEHVRQDHSRQSTIVLMTAGVFRPPAPQNEPVKSHAPGSAERAELKLALQRMEGERTEIPLVIGGEDVTTGDTFEAVMPHRKDHVLADVHAGGPREVERAIAAAGAAWPDWSRTPWEERAAIFLRAAELLAGPWRTTLNASTMLGQSKTAHQAEIDAACELIDFWRFNVEFMLRIYSEQPASSPGTWNRLEYRPLEGFVFAVSPFNFTSIAGNLPTSPALMGNTVLWKPASTSAFSAHFIMRLLQEAGLPDGVINLVYGSGPTIGDPVLASPDLAGIHFTGSTGVFQGMWKTVGGNIASYRSYPRIVGETGGKDFIVAHPSANVEALATAIVRGSFEYQGQKCSAASRVYAPANLWPALRDRLADDVGALKMGDVSDFSNFMGAVIDRNSFKTQKDAIEEARAAGAEIVAGGGYDDGEGFFVEPTVVKTDDPDFRLLRDELFGPVVTAYVYPEQKWSETLELVDRTAPYGLTGAVFSQDRAAIQEAHDALEYAAGNFYVNDKPTGAVVGQQPFGGARASGTNDKAGSMWNLIRWVSPRAIKETFVPPTDYRYPFMSAETDGSAPTDRP